MLRTTRVGYGGAAVGLQHAVYRWGATQAHWIPPIQTRILPYPRKVKLYPVNSVYYLELKRVQEQKKRGVPVDDPGDVDSDMMQVEE
jgi:hypothetical protein